jgi:hypothetical protein
MEEMSEVANKFQLYQALYIPFDILHEIEY